MESKEVGFDKSAGGNENSTKIIRKSNCKKEFLLLIIKSKMNSVCIPGLRLSGGFLFFCSFFFFFFCFGFRIIKQRKCFYRF